MNKQVKRRSLLILVVSRCGFNWFLENWQQRYMCELHDCMNVATDVASNSKSIIERELNFYIGLLNVNTNNDNTNKSKNNDDDKNKSCTLKCILLLFFVIIAT